MDHAQISPKRFEVFIMNTAHDINTRAASCSWWWWPQSPEQVLLVPSAEESLLFVCTGKGCEAQDLATSPWLEFIAERMVEETPSWSEV